MESLSIFRYEKNIYPPQGLLITQSWRDYHGLYFDVTGCTRDRYPDYRATGEVLYPMIHRAVSRGQY